MIHGFLGFVSIIIFPFFMIYSYMRLKDIYTVLSEINSKLDRKEEDK